MCCHDISDSQAVYREAKEVTIPQELMLNSVLARFLEKFCPLVCIRNIFEMKIMCVHEYSGQQAQANCHLQKMATRQK